MKHSVRQNRFLVLSNWLFTIAILASSLTGAAFADGPERALHRFKLQSGNMPMYYGGRLAMDKSGNLYGTTEQDGSRRANCGTVYELTPSSDKRTWTNTVLYHFAGGTDGCGPESGVTFDSAGNLYGTTWSGGSLGNGTIYELVPQPGGDWTEQVLYSFPDYNDGWFPVSLILDKAGNLYGAMPGYPNGYGEVFELIPGEGGVWTYNVVYAFQNGPDGELPLGGLTMDKSENLYGTTFGASGDCRRSGCGTIFRLKRPTNNGDPWSKTVLYRFTGEDDGAVPAGGVTFDAAGNLFCTTEYGGNSIGDGTVFELKRDGTHSVIHAFDRTTEGFRPMSRVVFDDAGNLYGSTFFSRGAGSGAIFKLSPDGTGGWIATTLYSFTGGMDGGIDPSSPILGPLQRVLYGTTAGGGFPTGTGVVFGILLH